MSWSGWARGWDYGGSQIGGIHQWRWLGGRRGVFCVGGGDDFLGSGFMVRVNVHDHGILLVESWEMEQRHWRQWPLPGIGP